MKTKTETKDNNIDLPQTGEPGSLRTKAEREAGTDYARIFMNCPDSIETKLGNFPKYVRLQNLTRFLARYEIFKQILGSVSDLLILKYLTQRR